MIDDALALGIHHAGVNVNITGLADPEKRPGNPKRVVDGYEFSFHESYLGHLDSQIKPLSDQGLLVYLVVIVYPSTTPFSPPSSPAQRLFQGPPQKANS